jgi:hypothetical protein
MDHLNYAKNLYSQAVDDLGKDQHRHYTMRLGQVAQAAALIALVEAQRELVAEQRKTNEILVSMIRVEHGSLAAGTALDNFTQHPRCPAGGEE